MTRSIDIGGGHSLEPVTATEGGPTVGFIDRHASAKDGSVCGGFVWIAGIDPAEAKRGPDAPTWTMESEEPLTLSPSLLCRSCGDHGFVRGGKWEPV